MTLFFIPRVKPPQIVLVLIQAEHNVEAGAEVSLRHCGCFVIAMLYFTRQIQPTIRHDHGFMMLQGMCLFSMISFVLG